MARTSNVVLTIDPHRGDEVPLAVLADRHDLPANTVTYRYRAGKRGYDLIKPRDERRIQPHQRQHVAPTCNRQEIIAAALGSPGVRQLIAPRLADLHQALEGGA